LRKRNPLRFPFTPVKPSILPNCSGFSLFWPISAGEGTWSHGRIPPIEDSRVIRYWGEACARGKIEKDQSVDKGENDSEA
jgi:hypothetical protein